MVDKVEEVEYESPASQMPRKLNTNLWTVSAEGSVNGGGTGLEFVENLQKEGTDYGNKWYDARTCSTWIQADLKEPKIIKMFELMSANDCPERDPYDINVVVTYENGKEDKIFEENGLNFESRFEKQQFYINCDQKIVKFRVNISKNKSLNDLGHWGTGTQLNEFVLYV